ncbi:MAG: GMP synthase [Saprospiraceae bacterium]|nr:GMP synthase [Saprospiraceae bacterium]
MEDKRIQVAILDMYDGTPNVGLAAIRRVVGDFATLDFQVFDVRARHEFPDFDFDLFICSGGPGDPREWDEAWTPKYFELVDLLWQYNLANPRQPKPAFFICHSFQMMCDHFRLGKVIPRKSRSIGVYPVHMTDAGRMDPLFRGLSDPFYAADSRYYQFVHPDKKRFASMGAHVLALEKRRPHVPLERAIMAVRFSNAWVGTQFHPEADPASMLHMLLETPKGEKIRAFKGNRKFDELIETLRDPAKLEVTYQTVLPAFLKECIARLKPAEATS